MKPKQINRAIAEHCGWKNLPFSDESWPPSLNYHGNLNAMHEAEKTLFESRSGHYERAWAMALSSVVSARGEAYEEYTPSDLRDVADCAHATAAQRAEAFLRTVGKWNDQ